MQVIGNENVWRIIERTLSMVDARLMNHGERVAFLACELMEYAGTYTVKERTDAAMLSLMHDIGAYKTDEIDKMIQFETSDIWEHSIYGYLFLQRFAATNPMCLALLYHHTDYKLLEQMEVDPLIKNIAGIIRMTDRIDLIALGGNYSAAQLRKYCGTLFDPKLVELFIQADESRHLIAKLNSGEYLSILHQKVAKLHYTDKEKQSYLEIIAYSIDFRSEFMALHTITTVSVSYAIGKLMGLDKNRLKKLYYGALLHDIGKVATPVDILEKPGALTDEEMTIMQHHVVLSGEILSGYIQEDVYRIAVRHHEKMDGSGYPLGLKGEELTTEEKICAIADIISALIRKRSYKEAFTMEKTMQILKNMMEQNKLCNKVTPVVLEHFEEVLSETEKYGKQMLQKYQAIRSDYEEIIAKTMEGYLPIPQEKGYQYVRVSD